MSGPNVPPSVTRMLSQASDGRRRPLWTGYSAAEERQNPTPRRLTAELVVRTAAPACAPGPTFFIR
jgi:hypothetical protein